ncbi:MAG: SWIM zinc finger family protein, partial [Flavobacterium sp.]
MSDTITYQYKSPSAINKSGDQDELFLAKYSEVEKKEAPCFFWGKLTNPFITARCLIALSNVVKSSFSLSPADLAKLKDPVVTAGNGKIRFEGFSHCAGVYARVDILPDGHDGEFLESGTTNVDFNQPMISALSRINRNEAVLLSVGKKDVSVSQGGEKITERKVPLPVKWIKGLTTVQLYMSEAEKMFSFNRTQALQLFQSIPNGKPKEDYYLVVRSNKPVFSAVKSLNSICVGGVHRLKLLEPLLPLADKLQVFPHPDMQSTTWQLYFGNVRFSLSLSRDAWRGFSGEGAALETLI